MTAQTDTERDLARMLVDVLNLPDTSPDDIAPGQPLFGDGLGLDSIDALEIAVAIAQRYGIQMRAEDEKTREVFHSLRSLATHIEAHRNSAAAG